ncbi:hypothetical protein QT654_20685 [Xanthomonas citri pv. citri]
MSRAAEARTKLDKAGIGQVCDDLCAGASLTGIANEVGVSLASLLAWVAADPDRSARVRETRAAMAKVWDERAEDEIRQADDEFKLKKAKELAHHYRWRAAKVAPGEYGEKVEVRAQVTLEQLVAESMGGTGTGGGGH